MGNLLQLLVTFLIAIVVLGIIWYAAALAGLPGNLRAIILLIAALIVLLWLVSSAGLLAI